MEKIVFLLATVAIIYAIIRFVQIIIADYKLQKSMIVCDASYKAMCGRIKSVEDDKRVNTGSPISKEKYLDHAEKINGTKMFEWINTPQNKYE